MNNNTFLDEKFRLIRQHRNGSGWFYWIAGLSLVNVIMTIINGNWGFVFGLGATDLIYYISQELSLEFGSTALTVGVAINLILLGMFYLIGRSARKGRNWGFIVGFIIYGLDAFLLAFISDYMSALFHLYPMYCIFKGLQANRKLLTIVDEEQEASYNTEASTSADEIEADNLTDIQRNFRKEMQEYNRSQN